jgi:hypothetical protein
MGTFFPFNDEPKRSIYFFAPKNVCDNIYDEIPTMREYSFKYIERMTDIERRTLITSFPIERLVEKGKRTKEEARDMFVKVIKDFVKEISVVTRTPASIEAVESGGKFIATIVFEEDDYIVTAGTASDIEIVIGFFALIGIVPTADERIYFWIPTWSFFCNCRIFWSCSYS